jgi:hypothetical protein
MTSEDTRTVRGRDLRRLLDSDLPDPVLVLVEGRIEVVASADRQGLEVVTRDDFLRGAGGADLTDDELEQHAATLSATVDTLGG